MSEGDGDAPHAHAPHAHGLVEPEHERPRSGVSRGQPRTPVKAEQRWIERDFSLDPAPECAATPAAPATRV